MPGFEWTLSSYDSDLSENEQNVAFLCYNESNLAVKFSHNFNQDILSTEIRHLLNVIKNKLVWY